MAPLRCLLVGMESANWRTLSLGLLKAAVEADPELEDVSVEALHLVYTTQDRVLAEVLERAPDVVAFSCYIWNFRIFEVAFERIREALPDALIVLGGPHAYPQAEKILREHPAVDAVVMGEGELTFRGLLGARLRGEPWDALPGLALRKHGAYVETPRPAPIADLDALPSPYLTGAMELDENDTILTIESSRGCVFDCSFCDWPGRAVKPRNFSLDRVLAEMEYAIKRCPKLRYFELSDADLFIQRKRGKEFLARARELLRGTTVQIHYSTYFGHLDDETIRLLDCSNFIATGGVQTATPGALEAVKRYFHKEKIESAVGKLIQASTAFRVQLELIFGLPGDDPESFRGSVDWALSLKPRLVCTYPALVLPGAEMGMHPERYDMVFKAEPPHQVLSTSRFSAEQIGATRTLSFRISALQLLHPVRDTLSHLAELVPRRPRPFLSIYEDFSAELVREGLLADGEGPSAQAGTMDGGAHACREIAADPARMDRTMAALERFAARILRDCGREDLLPLFERYWRGQEHGRRWLALARAPTPELAAALESDLEGRRGLWLGRESFADEAALARRAGEAAHLFIERPIYQPPCPRDILHADDPKDFGSHAPVDALVISHLFTRLPAADRRRWLSDLPLKKDARLVIWDDLRGASPLESMAAKLSLAGRDEPERDWTIEAAEREAASCGWKLRGAEKTAGVHRLAFSRIAA